MDRNFLWGRMDLEITPSLSARRAWIEITWGCKLPCASCVALRKESVDRNYLLLAASAERSVALRKESVDRNFFMVSPFGFAIRRSPQGERG